MFNIKSSEIQQKKFRNKTKKFRNKTNKTNKTIIKQKSSLRYIVIFICDYKYLSR